MTWKLQEFIIFKLEENSQYGWSSICEFSYPGEKTSIDTMTGKAFLSEDKTVIMLKHWSVHRAGAFDNLQEAKTYKNSLPEWNQTKYYMMDDRIHYCENNKAVPEEELNIIMPKLGYVKNPEWKWVSKSWLENKNKNTNYDGWPF